MTSPNDVSTDVRHSGSPGVVTVLYAGADRTWAEWLAEQLDWAGQPARLELFRLSIGEDLATVLRQLVDLHATVLIVLTEALVRVAGRGSQEWSAALRSVAVAAPDRIMTMSAGGRHLPAATARSGMLAAVHESDTRRMLLELVGVTPPVLGQPPEILGAARYPLRAPRHWSPLIPPRNHHFTGRDEILIDLRERLTGYVTAVVPSAVHGLGGVGKTQVAVEYAHRFACDYDLVWYVRSEQLATARADLAAMAVPLGIKISDDLGVTADAVLDALRRGDPVRNWLVIFDNAGSPRQLRRLLPAGGGHVLVTSRDQEWQDNADVISLEVYQRQESLHFLRRRMPDITDADADALAAEVGDFPLYLDSVVALLVATGMPVPRLLTEIRRHPTSTLGQVRVASYDDQPVMIWAMAMNRLREDRPAAAQLLRICAFLGPEPVSMALFAGPGTDPNSPVRLPEPLRAELGDPPTLGRVVWEIGRYALAKIDKRDTWQTIQMHRLVQAFLRDQLDTGQVEVFQTAAQRLLAAADPGEPELPANRRRYDELLPHLGPAEVATAAGDATVRALVRNAVGYLDGRGEYTAACHLAEAALPAWTTLLGPDSADVIALRVMFANALRTLGLFAEARKLDEESLVHARRSLGAEHPDTLAVANGLAADLRRLGDWHAAYELDTESLAASLRLPRLHPRRLRVAHNYAVSLRMMGRFPEALRVDEETLLANRERFEDLDNRTVLFSANNVARDLRECGRYQPSVEMQEDTYARYLRLLGDDHPDSLRAMKNLAVSLRKAGRYTAARDLAQSCYEQHCRRFGDHYPETLAASTNLANDLRLTGEILGARARAQDAYEQLFRTVGERHPYTLAAAVNLAVALRRTHDVAAAREIDERTYRLFTDVLGGDHPYTLACATNLASDLSESDDGQRARDLGDEVLARLTRVRGEAHPDTLACAINVAADHRAANDHATARQLHRLTVERYLATLGASHPDVVTATTTRDRIDCDVEPPPT